MKQSPINLLLFDLDGTLYLSTSILPKAYREGVRRYNQEHGTDVNVPEESNILEQVGNPADEIYRTLFPSLADADCQKLSVHILDRLVELIREDGGQLVEDVPELLSLFRSHFDLGLVTNARVKYMDAVLETYDLARFFDRLRCIGMVDSEEKAVLVQGMLDYFDVDPSETVMIGDRKSDYVASTETGTHFIGCDFGYASGGEFPSGTDVVDTLGELTQHPLLVGRTVND